MRLSMVTVQEELNPYDAETESFDRENFANHWYFGYIFVSVVWTALTMAAGDELSIGIKSLGVTQKATDKITDAISKAVKEMGDMAKYIEKVAKYAKVMYATKPGRTIIAVAMYTGTTGALYLAFPDLFNNAASLMLGTMTIATMFAPQIETGISPKIMQKVAELKAKSPRFGGKVDEVLAKQLKPGKISQEHWERTMEKAEESLNLAKTKVDGVVAISEGYAARTGGANVFVDASESCPIWNEMSMEGKDSYLKIISNSRYGKGAYSNNPYLRSHDLSHELDVLSSNAQFGKIPMNEYKSILKSMAAGIKSDAHPNFKGDVAKGRVFEVREISRVMTKSSDECTFTVNKLREAPNGNEFYMDLERTTNGHI
ncbi:MAG: hypothetical protein ACUVV6_08215, partial [Thermoplasmatota archaeon]